MTAQPWTPPGPETCEAPNCSQGAVTSVPDSTPRPRFWRVCREHLDTIAGRRRWRHLHDGDEIGDLIAAVRAEGL